MSDIAKVVLFIAIMAFVLTLTVIAGTEVLGIGIPVLVIAFMIIFDDSF